VRALETFAIYVTPFLILGAGAKLLMKRYGVDLDDVQNRPALSAGSANFSSWVDGIPKTDG